MTKFSGPIWFEGYWVCVSVRSLSCRVWSKVWMNDALIGGSVFGWVTMMD
jgi:hypothetical protein